MPVLQMGTLRVRKVPSLAYNDTAYWPLNPALGRCGPLPPALEPRDVGPGRLQPLTTCDLGGATSL